MKMPWLSRGQHMLWMPDRENPGRIEAWYAGYNFMIEPGENEYSKRMKYEDPHLLLVTAADEEHVEAAFDMKHQQDRTYGIYYDKRIPGCVYRYVYPTLGRAKAAARERLRVFQERLESRGRFKKPPVIPGVERYRTRQVEIEAICCTNDSIERVKSFAGDALVFGVDQPKLKVQGGAYQYVHFGDWIAKDADGFRVLLPHDINEWFERIDS